MEESRAVAYKGAVRDLAAGKTFSDVSKKHGIAVSTLGRIKKDCSDFIRQHQDRNLEQMVVARDMAVSAFIRRIDEVDPKCLPVAIGILDDKIDRAVSGPTRVEHVSVKLPTQVQVRDVIDLLPTAIDCDRGADNEQTTVNTGLHCGSSNSHDQAGPGEGVARSQPRELLTD